jgi:hypothetical protein
MVRNPDIPAPCGSADVDGGGAGPSGAVQGQAAALAASLMERMRQAAPQGAAARQAPAPGAAGGAAHAAPQAAVGGHAGGGTAHAERGIIKQLLDMGFSEIKVFPWLTRVGRDSFQTKLYCTRTTNRRKAKKRPGSAKYVSPALEADQQCRRWR